MHTQNNNEKCTYGIEKFEGTFDKEQFAVTIFCAEAINLIRNLTDLGIYAFIASESNPPDKYVSVLEISNHFKLHTKKVCESINRLLKLDVLERGSR